MEIVPVVNTNMGSKNSNLPKKDNKKELLANKLFAGVINADSKDDQESSGDSDDSDDKKKRRKRKKEKRDKKKLEESKQEDTNVTATVGATIVSNDIMNLLDFDDHQHVTSLTPTQHSNNLLDDMFSSNST